MACCVISCNSSKNSILQPGVTFYKFPNDIGRRRIWIEAVGRTNWRPTNNSVICSKHFKESDFLLKEDAVPIFNKKHILNIPKKDIIITRSKKHSILKESDSQSSRPPKIQKLFENPDTDNPETERLKTNAIQQSPSIAVVFRNNQPSVYAYRLNVCKLCKSTIPNSTQIGSNISSNCVPNTCTSLKNSSMTCGSSAIHNSLNSVTLLNAAEVPLSSNSASVKIFPSLESIRKEATICGRRIIDFEYFLNNLKTLNKHSKLGCNLNHMIITKEQKKGLYCQYYLQCKICSYESYISTEHPTEKSINADILLGMMDINCEWTQLNNFFSKIKLPVLSYDIFSSEREKFLSSDDGKGIKVVQESSHTSSYKNQQCNKIYFNQCKLKDVCESEKEDDSQSECELQKMKMVTDAEEFRIDKTSMKQKGKNDVSKPEFIHTKTTEQTVLVLNQRPTLNTTAIEKEIHTDEHEDKLTCNGLLYTTILGDVIEKKYDTDEYEDELNCSGLLEYDDFSRMSPNHKICAASEDKMNASVEEIHQEQICEVYEDKIDILAEQIQLDKSLDKQGNKDCSKSEFIHIKTMDNDILVNNKQKLLNTTKIKKEKSDIHKDELKESHLNEMMVSNDDNYVEQDYSNFSQPQKCKASEEEDDDVVLIEQIQINKTVVKKENKDDSEPEFLHINTTRKNLSLVNHEPTINTEKCDNSSRILPLQHISAHNNVNTLYGTNNKKEIHLRVCNDKVIKSEIVDDDNPVEQAKPSYTQGQKIITYVDKYIVDTQQIELLKALVKEENENGNHIHELSFVDIDTIRKNISIVDQEDTVNVTKFKKEI